jgi:hypothetical protein
MTKRVRVTIDDWSKVLSTYGGDAARQVAKNPKLLQCSFEVLKDISERHTSDAVARLFSGAGTKVSSTPTTGSSLRTGAKITSFMTSELQMSAGFRFLAIAAEGSSLATPGGAMAFVGATLVVKTGIALGLAGDDQARARCVGALMEVGGNVGVTAVTWESGVGAILGLVAIGVSGYSAYLECRK